MMILDAIFGCLLFKLFGVEGLYCLGMVVLVGVLRTIPRINRIIDDFYIIMEELSEEGECNE